MSSSIYNDLNATVSLTQLITVSQRVLEFARNNSILQGQGKLVGGVGNQNVRQIIMNNNIPAPRDNTTFWFTKETSAPLDLTRVEKYP